MKNIISFFHSKTTSPNTLYSNSTNTSQLVPCEENSYQPKRTNVELSISKAVLKGSPWMKDTRDRDFWDRIYENPINANQLLEIAFKQAGDQINTFSVGITASELIIQLIVEFYDWPILLALSPESVNGIEKFALIGRASSKSTWYSGAGCCTPPPLVESGTLKAITVRLVPTEEINIITIVVTTVNRIIHNYWDTKRIYCTNSENRSE